MKNINIIYFKTSFIVTVSPVLFYFFVSYLYAGNINDIRQKLGIEKTNAKNIQDDKSNGKSRGFVQETGKYFIVQANNIVESEAKNILNYAEKIMQEFMKIYEYSCGSRKCYIIVYGEKSDFDKDAQQKHMENSRAFVYNKGINNYVIIYYDKDIYSVLSHEIFHVLIDNIFKGAVPYWFNEGMACYYETSEFNGKELITNRINKSRLFDAKGSVNAKCWPKIKNLVRYNYDQFYKQNTSINYAASWILVYFLKNKNEKSFKAFSNDLALGKNFSTCVRSNYGIDDKQLEKQWIEYIKTL